MARIILSMMVAGVVSACASAAGDGKPPPRAIAPPTRIPNPTLDENPAGTPVSTATIPRAIRRAVVADAARRFGVAENQVVISRAEQVTWRDGSLGCPEPGQMYTQAQVPGFRIYARTAAGEFLYHTDSQATARNCHMAEGPAPQAPDR